MFLSIATTHRPATDLGNLLVKHPDRLHEFELASGRALVLFPEAIDTARHAQAWASYAWPVAGVDNLRVAPCGLIQPACGPDYDATENLTRLPTRGVGRKRGMALREFALGHEALTRFVAGGPLRRIHECVFAVLALESEPIDPRL